GEQLAQRQGVSVFRVGRFVEKPNPENAERFFGSGEFFWNSGIFVWRAATILAQLKQHRPSLYDGVQRIAEAWNSGRRQEVLKRESPTLDKISIDKAVMEHAPDVLVVQAPYRWDDVGSWLALERMNPQDSAGNTVLANHCGLDTRHCVIVGEPGR